MPHADGPVSLGAQHKPRARLVPLDEARGRGGERLGVIDGGAEGRRAERQWRRHTYGPAQGGKREEVDLVRMRVVRVKGEGEG